MARSDVSAVVYDLDGTLVDLLVDWEQVTDDVAAIFTDHGVDASNADDWGMLDVADETGLRDEVEAVVAEHERDGARRSTRLPHADELVERDGAVGVCSLNCESACRVGLAVHELDDHVDAVVGRDSVPTRKPDPEPLLATMDAMGVEDALFVGDSRRDELTAERAGVTFEYV